MPRTEAYALSAPERWWLNGRSGVLQARVDGAPQLTSNSRSDEAALQIDNRWVQMAG